MSGLAISTQMYRKDVMHAMLTFIRFFQHRSRKYSMCHGIGLDVPVPGMRLLQRDLGGLSQAHAPLLSPPARQRQVGQKPQGEGISGAQFPRHGGEAGTARAKATEGKSGEGRG